VPEREQPSLAMLAHERKLAVAIDGPSAAGKTTVGRALARLLEVPLLDTGLMYRAVTRAAQDGGIDPCDSAAIESLSAGMKFSLAGVSDHSRLSVDGKAQEETELHRYDIDATVSVVAAHPSVRRILVDAQRRLAADTAIVMLGRDIGTVVLPDASVKLFITADPEIRAARRRLEREADVTANRTHDVAAQLATRDFRDTTRETSPLRQAPDAILLETTNTSSAETFERAREAVARALGQER
jgi:cytidylate kinase